MRRRPAALVLLLATLHAAAALVPALAPAVAEAQSSNDTYKQHMKNGVKLYEDKNYGAAIVEFQAAYEVDPKASPLLNIALCQKSLFAYPKAIAALEKALAKHGDTMSADDKKAAEDAITEMRSLLAYVNVRLTPAQATLTVDGEDQPAGAAQKPVPLAPGAHKIGAHAPGYAAGEQSVTVASGEKERVVVLRLTADKGWVSIRGHDAKTTIVVDGKHAGVGQWADLLPPGTHVVTMVRPGMADYSCDVLVLAGKSQDVSPGVGCSPHVGPPPTLPPPMPSAPPPPPKKPPPEEPPMRGFFALATGSLLFPTAHPSRFPSSDPTSGAAGGIRVGYRVNTPASFDLMFEYGNVTSTADSTSLAGTTEVEYSISSARFGLDLRLMTPGKTARLVGTIGGGFSLGSLSEYRGNQNAIIGDPYCPDDCSGADPFLLGELGLELDFGGVLVGLSAQSYFQSTKGMETDGFKPYDNDPLIFLGGGLRVGYGTW